MEEVKKGVQTVQCICAFSKQIYTEIANSKTVDILDNIFIFVFDFGELYHKFC